MVCEDCPDAPRSLGTSRSKMGHKTHSWIPRATYIVEGRVLCLTRQGPCPCSVAIHPVSRTVRRMEAPSGQSFSSRMRGHLTH